jgi:glycosyltransferase involved in cell wall biosynthesis
MVQYVLDIPDTPKILDQENAVSTVVERLYRLQRPGPAKLLTYFEWRKLRRYEAYACSQFDYVLTVTEQDRQALQALTSGRGRFAVIPIGIDCDAVRPVTRKPDGRNIITIGNLHWPPNADGVLWFAREVLPLVKQQIPEARLYVVGKNPPKEVCKLQVTNRKLQSSHQPSAISHQPIVITGYVEDPTPYFADSVVFIVPLHAGGGMRVKILDAWARGIPIVSTTIGCEGIEVRDGENILIADIPRGFAQAVMRVMRDKELARRLAENGRRWVEERYDWRTVYRRLDGVYDGLMSPSSI